MAEYQVTITISVSDIEAPTEADALQFVRDMVNEVLDEHRPRFSNQSALNYDE